MELQYSNEILQYGDKLPLSDYEALAMRTVYVPLEDLKSMAMSGLVEESAELFEDQERVIRILSPLNDDLSPDFDVGLVLELGDIAWYLSAHARTEGLSIQECILAATEGIENLGGIEVENCADLLLISEEMYERNLPSKQVNLSGFDTDNLQFDRLLCENPLFFLSALQTLESVHDSRRHIGDMLIALTQVGKHTLGVNPETILACNIAKLENRARRGVLQGQGDYR